MMILKFNGNFRSLIHDSYFIWQQGLTAKFAYLRKEATGNFLTSYRPLTAAQQFNCIDTQQVNLVFS